MSGLETNLKSTRPRPGHYETKTDTETLKIGLETFINGRRCCCGGKCVGIYNTSLAENA